MCGIHGWRSVVDSGLEETEGDVDRGDAVVGDGMYARKAVVGGTCVDGEVWYHVLSGAVYCGRCSVGPCTVGDHVLWGAMYCGSHALWGSLYVGSFVLESPCTVISMT